LLLAHIAILSLWSPISLDIWFCLNHLVHIGQVTVCINIERDSQFKLYKMLMVSPLRQHNKFMWQVLYDIFTITICMQSGYKIKKFYRISIINMHTRVRFLYATLNMFSPTSDSYNCTHFYANYNFQITNFAIEF